MWSFVRNLTVVSEPFLIVLVLVAVASWFAVWWHFRQRHGRIMRWTSVLAAFALTVTVAADGVNSYFSYLPNVSDVVGAVTQTPPPALEVVEEHPPAPPAKTTHGKLVTITIPATDAQTGRTKAWVWLPPQYFSDPGRRFPVVYLFHGSPGMPRDWFHAGRADQIGLRLANEGLPAIEVAPQMSRDWLDDSECVDGRHERIETRLLQQVIPTVDRSLRTVADRDGRIFAGMSAGGFCALNLGLRNRAVSSTILDLSGFTVPTHSGGMKALFGPDAAPAAAANTPAEYARHLKDGPSMRVWLDSGTGDGEVLREMRQIEPTLKADRMNVQLHTRPGGHTYSVWRPALSEALAWALPQLPVR